MTEHDAKLAGDTALLLGKLDEQLKDAGHSLFDVIAKAASTQFGVVLTAPVDEPAEEPTDA